MEGAVFPPSSPGKPPVELRECIEELLKFTLTSSLNGTLDFDLGLSNDYCSNLLKDDPNDPTSDATDYFKGVPPYPIYKCLASALYQSISSGVLCWRYNKMVFINEDNPLKQKEDEWTKLILDKGSELLKVLKTIDFELHVQEPFFSQIKDGLKTIEGRCATGEYNRIGSGTLILFNKCVVLEVQDVRPYASFSEMLAAESLARVLPGIKTVEEGIQKSLDATFQVCKFTGSFTQKRRRSPMVSLQFVLQSQHLNPTFLWLAYFLRIMQQQQHQQQHLYNLVKYMCAHTQRIGLVEGLSYGGVQGLLGLMHTAGTIPEALPPPSLRLKAAP